MLSRAANAMFWLARYVERMDAVARLIETAVRLDAMAEGGGDSWRSAIIAAGCDVGFDAKHDVADYRTAVPYLASAPDNPSSILSCIEAARFNARAMRTSLTRDMWEVVNEAWIGAREFTPASFDRERLPETLDWVKRQATLFNGAYASTMLRNDVYWFTRLGTYLERADTTARLLDVKYNVLLPDYASVGGFVDYQQWTSVLQAVSAVRAYHYIYKDQVKPWHVAELMILRPEMPRSLRACHDEITIQLDRLANSYGGQRGECHRLAGELHARLRFGTVDGIFREGLHEFLTGMIDRTEALGVEVERFYMS
jgi:uncharacterized alpha-E superfamily protein